MTTQTADTKFLKRILFCLIAATIAVGSLAGAATVNAGAHSPNHSFFDYESNFSQ